MQTSAHQLRNIALYVGRATEANTALLLAGPWEAAGIALSLAATGMPGLARWRPVPAAAGRLGGAMSVAAGRFATVASLASGRLAVGSAQLAVPLTVRSVVALVRMLRRRR